MPFGIVALKKYTGLLILVYIALIKLQLVCHVDFSNTLISVL